MTLTAYAMGRALARVARTAALLLSVFSSGCQLFGGLHVETVASSAAPPGQVAAYVAVSDGDEAAVQLDENNFHLSEDGKPLDNQQVGLRLLSRDAAIEHHVLVLVDLSGPIEDKGARSLLASQLAPFVERLRQQQSVSVYGFDGTTDLVQLGRFAKMVHGDKAPAPAASELARINEFKQRDPSSNLNGALKTAIHQLTATLLRSDKTVQLGSIVVIARGPDLAGRTKDDEVDEARNETRHKLYAVTFGEDDQGLGERIGPDGAARATLFENMETALADVARLLENDYNRYYLLSYCSPARAGRRELTVRVERPDADGKVQSAETYIEFDAGGFRSGCDSGVTPRFARPDGAQPSKTGDAPAAESGSAPSNKPEEVAPPPASGNYAL